MLKGAPQPPQTAIRTDLGAIFVSIELSRRAWLITSLSPGAGEKMSRHSVPASDVSGLLRRFAELRRKAAARTGPGWCRRGGGGIGRWRNFRLVQRAMTGADAPAEITPWKTIARRRRPHAGSPERPGSTRSRRVSGSGYAGLS